MTEASSRQQTEDKILRLLGLAQRAGRLTAGLDATMAGIRRGDVKLLIIAETIGSSSKKKILRQAESCNCAVLSLRDADALARALGVRKRSIVGVKDSDFAAGIRQAAEAGAIALKDKKQV